jgi:phosphonopyruvate decarboxylase
MHMGGLALIGTLPVPNLVHVVLNNGAHDSVGGQPTVAREIDLCAVALACGYKRALKAESRDFLRDVSPREGPVFVEVPVRKGNRPDLGRPYLSPRENKNLFMREL